LILKRKCRKRNLRTTRKRPAKPRATLAKLPPDPKAPPTIVIDSLKALPCKLTS
jgi:hypothetical protein